MAKKSFYDRQKNNKIKPIKLSKGVEAELQQKATLRAAALGTSSGRGIIPTAKYGNDGATDRAQYYHWVLRHKEVQQLVAALPEKDMRPLFTRPAVFTSAYC